MAGYGSRRWLRETQEASTPDASSGNIGRLANKGQGRPICHLRGRRRRNSYTQPVAGSSTAQGHTASSGGSPRSTAASVISDMQLIAGQSSNDTSNGVRHDWRGMLIAGQSSAKPIAGYSFPTSQGRQTGYSSSHTYFVQGGDDGSNKWWYEE